MKDASPARRRIALLYHSGAGGTALVARLLAEQLSARSESTAASVGDEGALEEARRADFLVLLFPTYYLRPSPSMLDFIAELGPFDPPRPAYLVATYELYTENAIRAAALLLKERGVEAVGSMAVRAPGSDISCVFPAPLIPWLYRFERGFARKLHGMVADIAELAAMELPRPALPAPKWYTPIAQLLQIAVLNRFDRIRFRLRVLPERCTGCGSCVALCDRKAWSLVAPAESDARGTPIVDPTRCELCTRCIQRCPSLAIVLVAALKDNRRLDQKLYSSLEEDARRAFGER
jgi:ferredoxin/flavodoxin